MVGILSTLADAASYLVLAFIGLMAYGYLIRHDKVHQESGLSETAVNVASFCIIFVYTLAILWVAR